MSRNARNSENGERSPEGWQFKLVAKSGSLESGDFGENGNLAKMTKNHQAPWWVAILAKLFGVGVPEELSQLYSGGSVILSVLYYLIVIE